MNYRSISDLNNSIVNSLYKLPRDIDLIVGIPRSGMLAANILALHLNLPFTDLEGFLEGRILSTGIRYFIAAGDNSNSYTFQKALILDDSVGTGRTINTAREKVNKTHISQTTSIYYACIYIEPGQESLVDYFFETCPAPRLFEWNLMHHPILEDSCIDIDGVLCRDPNKFENDDGPNYRKFVKHCEPLFLPTVQVGYLVTCRLEKYRQDTEEWLRRYRVRYKELVMMNYPDMESRLKSARHAEFKARVYQRTGAKLFIESSKEQAVDIANITGKNVYCVELKTMVTPNFVLPKVKYKLNYKGERIFYRSACLLRKTPLFPPCKKFYMYISSIRSR